MVSIDRWHLDCGINISVEMQALHRAEIGFHQAPAGAVVIGFRFRIVLDLALCERDVTKLRVRLLGADDRLA